MLIDDICLKTGLRLLAPAACALMLGLGLAASSFAAGSFDGSYTGTQRTVRSNNSASCADLNHDHLLLVVQDNHFDRHWGRADLGVDVGPDGSFSASQSVSDRGQMRNIEISGKIVNGNLEADIGSPLCAAHLSLKKS